MANLNLVINSTFKPFSLERYLKPYEEYGKAYAAQEAAISDLESQAATIEAMASEQDDPESFNTYKKYANSLREQADRLATQGLSIGSRRAILDLKRQYNTDILPIATQFKKRESWREAQQKLDITSGGAYRFDNDARKMSLDKFVRNPNLTYTALNGQAIAQDVAEQAAIVANTFLHEPKFKETAEGKYLLSQQMKGYTLEEAMQAAAGDENAPKGLKDIYNNVISKYGSNPAWDLDWAKPYMQRGFMQGVQGYNQSLTANPDYENTESIDYKKKLAEYNNYIESTDFVKTDKPDIVRGVGKDKNYYRIDPKTGKRTTVIDKAAAEKEIAVYKKNNDVGPAAIPSAITDKMDVNANAGYDTNTSGSNPVYMIDFTTRKGAWLFGKSQAEDFIENPNNDTAFDTSDKGFGSGLVTFEDLAKDQDQFKGFAADASAFQKSSDNIVTINTKLKKLGLTKDDVLIFRDSDIFSNNHYRIVVKPKNLDMNKLNKAYSDNGKYSLSFDDIFDLNFNEDIGNGIFEPIVKNEYAIDSTESSKTDSDTTSTDSSIESMVFDD